VLGFNVNPNAVQVNYLVYPGTSGAGFVQYLVADTAVVPPEHSPQVSEKLWYMPGTYQVAWEDA
jgi:predicted O-linked N-acetylglucosamine transferase (SPINDLY family)